jgi:hypothetical protein
VKNTYSIVFHVVDYKRLARGMPFRVADVYKLDSHSYAFLDREKSYCLARGMSFRIGKDTYICRRDKRQDSRCKIQDTRFKMLDTGYWKQNAGFMIHDSRFRIRDSSIKVRELFSCEAKSRYKNFFLAKQNQNGKDVYNYQLVMNN